MKTVAERKRLILYMEIRPELKRKMQSLANRHRRKLTGEVVTAIEEYIARVDAAKIARRDSPL